MTQPGFIKLHRKVQGHWVASRPDWYAGWIDILLSADWKTGDVVLTHVPARKHFGSRKAWKEFIDRLREDGMLSDVTTKHLGQRRGSEQRAKVANWTTYHSSGTQASHGEKTGNSKVNSKRNANLAPRTRNIREEETPNETAKVTQSKKFKKGSLQTDSLLTTDALPPADLKAQARIGHCPSDIEDQAWFVWKANRPEPDTHAAWTNLYLDHRAALDLLVRLKELTKAKAATVKTWTLQLARDCERDANAATAALEDTLANPTVRNAWAYYRASVDRRQSKTAASESFRVGQFVQHPDTLEQGKITELHNDGTAVLEVGDFYHPDHVTIDIRGWLSCDLN